MTPTARAARFLVAAAASAILLTMAPASATAQGDTRPRVELRGELLAAERATTAHLGLGVAIPSGTYLRFALVAAGGPTWADGDAAASGRVDAVARFHVDPFRESRWAPYGVGGASVLLREGARRAFALTLGIGLEGRPRGGVSPAIEVALGGGLRAGLVLRHARRDRR